MALATARALVPLGLLFALAAEGKVMDKFGELFDDMESDFTTGAEILDHGDGVQAEEVNTYERALADPTPAPTMLNYTLLDTGETCAGQGYEEVEDSAACMALTTDESINVVTGGGSSTNELLNVQFLSLTDQPFSCMYSGLLYFGSGVAGAADDSYQYVCQGEQQPSSTRTSTTSVTTISTRTLNYDPTDVKYPDKCQIWYFHVVTAASVAERNAACFEAANSMVSIQPQKSINLLNGTADDGACVFSYQGGELRFWDTDLEGAYESWFEICQGLTTSTESSTLTTDTTTGTSSTTVSSSTTTVSTTTGSSSTTATTTTRTSSTTVTGTSSTTGTTTTGTSTTSSSTTTDSSTTTPTTTTETSSTTETTTTETSSTTQTTITETSGTTVSTTTESVSTTTESSSTTVSTSTESSSTSGTTTTKTTITTRTTTTGSSGTTVSTTTESSSTTVSTTTETSTLSVSSTTRTSSTGSTTTTTATTTTPTQYVLLEAGQTCVDEGYDEVDDEIECFYNASDFLNLTSVITERLAVEADFACALQFGEVLFFGNGNPGTADLSRQYVCKGEQAPSSTTTDTSLTTSMTTTTLRFNATKVNEPDICQMWYFHVVESNDTTADRDLRQTLCFQAAASMTTVHPQRFVSLLPVGTTSTMAGCVFNTGGAEITFYDQDLLRAYIEWLDICDGLTTSTESSSTSKSETSSSTRTTTGTTTTATGTTTTETSSITRSTTTETSSTTVSTSTGTSRTTVSTTTGSSSTSGTMTTGTSSTTVSTTTDSSSTTLSSTTESSSTTVSTSTDSSSTTASTTTESTSTTVSTTTESSSTTVSTATGTSSTSGTTTTETSSTTGTATTGTSSATGTTTTETSSTTGTTTTETSSTTVSTNTESTGTTGTTTTGTVSTTKSSTTDSSTTTVTTTTPIHYVLLPAGQTCAEAGYYPVPDATGCFYNATEYLEKVPATTVEQSDAEHACVVKFGTVWFFGNGSYDVASESWEIVCQGEEQSTSTTTETTSSTSATTTSGRYDPSNIAYPDVCQEWYFHVANGSTMQARQDQCTYVSHTMTTIKHYQVEDEDTHGTNNTILLDRTIAYVDVSTEEKEEGYAGCVFSKGGDIAYFYDSTLSTASNIKVIQAYVIWLDICDGLTTSTESSTMTRTFTVTTTETSSTTGSTTTDSTSTTTESSVTTLSTTTESSRTTVSATTRSSSTSGTTTTGTSGTTVSMTTDSASTTVSMTTESSSTTVSTSTYSSSTTASTTTASSSTTVSTTTESSITTVSTSTRTSSTSGTTATETSITTRTATTETSSSTTVSTATESSSSTTASTSTESSRTTVSTTTESSSTTVSTTTESSSTTVSTSTGTSSASGTETTWTGSTTASVHTTSITSSFSTSTATITSTFTPERWSQVKCAIGLSFEQNVTDEEVENATLIALTNYLNDSDILITIDSVTSQDRTDVSGRLLTAGDETFNFQIVYTLNIPGMATDDAAALLWDLFHNHTAFDATIAEVLESIGLGNFSVYYATEPNVINWYYTTITLTSTTATSTTCCVCNLPNVSDVPAGVPVGLLADVEEQVSNLSDLIRIECMGFSWFDTCNPKCGPGYVEAEQMVCANRSLDQKMVPSTFTGEARCERDVCPGSPFNGTIPTGYEPAGPDCTDMLFQDRCNFSCSDGYTDNGIPVQRECLATTTWPDAGPVEYGFAEGSGFCTEKSCDDASVPYMWDVSNSSVCVGTGSRQSCSPVCNVSYELVEPVNCTKGQFDEIPLVCVPSEHAAMLELVEVLLIRMAIASSDSGSAEGLTAVWANIPSSDAAIKSSLVKMLGVLPGQVFVKGKKDLNSDWSSVTPTARRLTTLQGLYFEVVLQPTELVNLSALSASSSGLAGGSFVDELTDALQDAGVDAPPGLATANFEVGPIEHVSYILPVARWLVRTDWSSCSNLCGVGAHTRTVECVGAWGSDATDMCNANAAPGFTMESYMPDSEPCEQWTSCAYDWKCPSGPDPVTGEGCELQASGVAIGLVAAALCCCCLLGAFLRRWCKARPQKDIVWERRVKWNRGCATLTPKGGRGDPIGPVDLDFSGATEFMLQIRVTTTAKDSLLIGKVYRSGDATLRRGGEAKALVIKQGFPAWQVGEGTIYGKTYIADGEQHDISISYSGRDDEYVLMVDGIEEARGLHGVADNPDTSLVLGTASAPRDDTFNVLYPLFDELRRAGVETSPLEDRAEEPLFDGDIDGLTWREYRWSDEHGYMDWFVYDLHIGDGEAIGERTTMQSTVDGTPPFHKGQAVEYWSKTVQTWMPAKILNVTDPYYDNTLRLFASSFDVYVGAASQTALGVGMMDLRLPFVEGESVSVFSQKYGSWFPARIHRSRHASDPTRGYDIRLEESELQKDLARYKGIPGQHDDEPLLKNMTAKRLRRRYDGGEPVLVYRGASEGFVKAEVVQEEAEHKPEMEKVAVATGVHHDGSPSHSPSPERELAGAATRMSPSGSRSPSPPGKASSNDDAQRKARQYNFSDQRHAIVFVRRIRSGSTVPQETMKVPEYALRRRSEDSPHRRSSPHAEDAFEL